MSRCPFTPLFILAVPDSCASLALQANPLANGYVPEGWRMLPCDYGVLSIAMSTSALPWTPLPAYTQYPVPTSALPPTFTQPLYLPPFSGNMWVTAVSVLPPTAPSSMPTWLPQFDGITTGLMDPSTGLPELVQGAPWQVYALSASQLKPYLGAYVLQRNPCVANPSIPGCVPQVVLTSMYENVDKPTCVNPAMNSEQYTCNTFGIECSHDCPETFQWVSCTGSGSGFVGEPQPITYIDGQAQLPWLRHYDAAPPSPAVFPYIQGVTAKRLKQSPFKDPVPTQVLDVIGSGWLNYVRPADGLYVLSAPPAPGSSSSTV